MVPDAATDHHGRSHGGMAIVREHNVDDLWRMLLKRTALTISDMAMLIRP